jgi:hypothetical protein
LRVSEAVVPAQEAGADGAAPGGKVTFLSDATWMVDQGDGE